MLNLIVNFRKSTKRKGIKKRRTGKRKKVKRKRTKTGARINTKKRKIERKGTKIRRTRIKIRHQMKREMKEEKRVAMDCLENSAIRLKRSRTLSLWGSWAGGLEMKQQGMDANWHKTSLLLLIREEMRDSAD